MIKKIYIAGDHAGYYDKEKIKAFLEKKGFSIIDFGPSSYNKKDDYPDFVIPLAKKLSKTRNAGGIIIAGSGVGEAIASNKIKNIRAFAFHGDNTKIVKTSREHDDTNVLAMGSRLVSLPIMKRAIDVWLKTPFKKGRHKRRLNKIAKMTKQ